MQRRIREINSGDVQGKQKSGEREKPAEDRKDFEMRREEAEKIKKAKVKGSIDLENAKSNNENTPENHYNNNKKNGQERLYNVT